jgi:hypothetical protein
LLALTAQYAVEAFVGSSLEVTRKNLGYTGSGILKNPYS